MQNDTQSEQFKKDLLDNEKFIADILAARGTKVTKWWESTVIVSLGTAIVTAVITIGGGYVAQISAKQKETALAKIEYERNKKREFLTGTYSSLGAVHKAIEDRLSLAKGEYDKLPASELKELGKEANDAIERWRKEKESSDFYIRVYYGDQPPLLIDWQNMCTSLESYGSCAELTFHKFNGLKAPPDSCLEERKNALNTFVKVKNSLADEYRKGAFEN